MKWAEPHLIVSWTILEYKKYIFEDVVRTNWFLHNRRGNTAPKKPWVIESSPNFNSSLLHLTFRWNDRPFERTLRITFEIKWAKTNRGEPPPDTDKFPGRFPRETAGDKSETPAGSHQCSVASERSVSVLRGLTVGSSTVHHPSRSISRNERPRGRSAGRFQGNNYWTTWPWEPIRGQVMDGPIGTAPGDPARSASKYRSESLAATRASEGLFSLEEFRRPASSSWSSRNARVAKGAINLLDTKKHQNPELDRCARTSPNVTEKLCQKMQSRKRRRPSKQHWNRNLRTRISFCHFQFNGLDWSLLVKHLELKIYTTLGCQKLSLIAPTLTKFTSKLLL